MIALEEIDIPEVLAEVTEAFRRYETALVTNDVATLDALFFADARTVRYGAGECLYGRDEILAFRKGRPSKGLERTLTRTSITTYGRDFAVASTEFAKVGEARTGRQMQTWARTPDGWRVVAAHVSFMEG
ncbi:MAG: oxalurate catabolism protein HpxZ [Rhodobacteraceae bacterium]|nr:MAG: oxalurate catabolism protein HpxZ [Paracoccaceae bacterium]